MSAGVAATSPSEGLREQLAEDLASHAAFGDKISGGQGDLATAEWIAGRLERSGYSIETTKFDIPSFDARETKLTIGANAIDIFAQPVVVATPPTGITAPVALVHDVYEAVGARDKIALIVLPFERHASVFSRTVAPLLNAAVQAGAKAAVLVPTGPTGKIVALNTRLTPVAPIAVAVIAPAEIPAVLKAIQGDQPATLTITGTSGTRTTPNIVGTRKRGLSWLVISTPRTGWFGCVGERGTGTAAFLELCAWAAQQFPELSVLAINSGGHEYDFSGMHRAMGSAPPAEQTLLWAHLGAGLATRDSLDLGGRDVGGRELGLLPSADPQRVLMTTDNLRVDATAAFAGISGLERPIPILPGAGELSGMIDHGYRRAFAVLGIHRWFHTRDDGLDKVDAGLLLPVVEAHKRIISAALR
jgi:hypothetical protein